MGAQAHTTEYETTPLVFLLSRAASPSLAVIAVTVKIHLGRMTMIDLVDGKEVVWGRF